MLKLSMQEHLKGHENYAWLSFSGDETGFRNYLRQVERKIAEPEMGAKKSRKMQS